jgi:hypothetical protein
MACHPVNIGYVHLLSAGAPATGECLSLPSDQINYRNLTVLAAVHLDGNRLAGPCAVAHHINVAGHPALPGWSRPDLYERVRALETNNHVDGNACRGVPAPLSPAIAVISRVGDLNQKGDVARSRVPGGVDRVASAQHRDVRLGRPVATDQDRLFFPDGPLVSRKPGPQRLVRSSRSASSSRLCSGQPKPSFP